MLLISGRYLNQCALNMDESLFMKDWLIRVLIIYLLSLTNQLHINKVFNM